MIQLRTGNRQKDSNDRIADLEVQKFRVMEEKIEERGERINKKQLFQICCNKT